MKTWHKVAAWTILGLGAIAVVTDDDKGAPAAKPPAAAARRVERAAPTAAPTDAPVDPAAEYGQWVRARMTELAKPIGTSQELLAAMSENPALVLDGEWKTKMGFSLGLIQASARVMQEHPAPPGAEDAKAALVAATDSLIQASDLMAPALDAVDADGLAAGMAKITEAGGRMDALATELDKIDPR